MSITCIHNPWCGCRFLDLISTYIMFYRFCKEQHAFFSNVISLHVESTECGCTESWCPYINIGWLDKVIEGSEVVLKVETVFLMNTVTAAKNTNAHVPHPPCASVFWIPLPIWPALNVANDPFLLRFVSFTFSLPPLPTYFFASLLFPAALLYRFIFSHAIFLSSCCPAFPASCLLSLCFWLAGWFILLSAPCRYTLGRAPLLWTGYVWAYLLQRWAKCCWITQAPFQAYRLSVCPC